VGFTGPLLRSVTAGRRGITDEKGEYFGHGNNSGSEHEKGRKARIIQIFYITLTEGI